MKKIFSHYYLRSDKDFPKLWENCLFILDTNILLNLYRFPKEAREDLLNIFSKISDRLWIPFQVALEFQENRLSVIAEQKNSYNAVKDKINKTIEQLSTDISNLQLKTRHSLINPDSFLEKIKKLTKEFTEELDSLNKKQPDVSDKDALRDEIDKLFSNKVGSPPTDKELEEIYKEGDIRNKLKRPPGYRDINKDKEEKDSYFYKNLELQRKFGDFLIWKQIIQKAKKGHQYIVFITDDGKEDWWRKIRGKIVGARPELVEEISNEAGVTIFQMYNSEQFMKYANEFLRIHLNENSLDQVRDIVNLAKEKEPYPKSSHVDREIFKWVKSNHPNGMVEHIVNKVGDFLRVRIDNDYYVYRFFALKEMCSWQTVDFINFIDHGEKTELGTVSPLLKDNNFEILVLTHDEPFALNLINLLLTKKRIFPITIGSLVYDEDFGAELFLPLRKIQPSSIDTQERNL